MHYIVRHTGKGNPDTKALKKVLDKNDIRILDSSALPKMALLDEITEHLALDIKKQLPGGYELFAERGSFNVPDTRQKIARDDE